MARAWLVTLAMLVHCGSRTDLGGARHLDASAGDSCTATIAPTTCAPSLCGNGGCIAKLSEQSSTFALDDAHLFWITSTALLRADKCGANETLLVGCLSEAALMGLSAIDVYFRTVVFENDTPHETLFRVSKDGGAPVALASYDTDIQALAVDGDALFFTLGPRASQPGRLVRMPATGGVETTLFTGNVRGALAADADEVFFGVANNLVRMKEDGSALTVMADMTLSGIGVSTAGIVLDATHVYTTSGCGDVQSVARDGSNVNAEVLGIVSQASGSVCYAGGTSIARDGAFVYLGFGGNGATPSSILRVPKTGGTLDTVVTLTSDPVSIAIDASGLFWADETSLSVLTQK